MRQRLTDDIKMRALGVLPKNLVSRAFGVVAEVELPSPLQRVVNQGFARIYDLNVGEAERAPGEYTSLNAFFTRRLKAGVRAIEADASGDLVSPVDGRLTHFGAIEHDTLMQAKGRTYSLVDLLDSAEEAARFRGGSYATIYLSPRDYHRIHSPAMGRIEKLSYVPGHLWPVNPLSVRNVDRLFAINERLISFITTEALGRVAVIKVGATCVGRIGLAFNQLESNSGFRRRQDLTLEAPVQVAPGDDLAVFNLGSTVILLIAAPGYTFSSDLVDGQAVRMGQRLGGCS